MFHPDFRLPSNREFARVSKSTRTWLVFVPMVVFALGCSPSPLAFSPNRLLTFRVEAELQVEAEPLESQVQSAIRDSFGSPDKPLWPSYLSNDKELGQLVNIDYLRRAAGPFGRDHDSVETGLFSKALQPMPRHRR